MLWRELGLANIRRRIRHHRPRLHPGNSLLLGDRRGRIARLAATGTLTQRLLRGLGRRLVLIPKAIAVLVNLVDLNEALPLANTAQSLDAVQIGLGNVKEVCPGYTNVALPTDIPPTPIPPTPIGGI